MNSQINFNLKLIINYKIKVSYNIRLSSWRMRRILDYLPVLRENASSLTIARTQQHIKEEDAAEREVLI